MRFSWVKCCFISLFLLAAGGPHPARSSYPPDNGPSVCIDLGGDRGWVGVQLNPAAGTARCLSYDGVHCLWSANGDICRGSSTPTFLECGEQYGRVYPGETGFEDPGSWCSRAREFLPAAGGAPSRVEVGAEIRTISNVPEPGNSPDGTLPSLQLGDRWALHFPNPLNFRSFGPTPFYQDLPQGSFQLVYGWIPCQNPAKFGTFFQSGFWIFHIVRVGSGRLVGLGHAEAGSFGNGVCKGAGLGDGATFKVLAVAWSDDDGGSWTDPQIIVSSRPFDFSVPTDRWSGAGDPGFAYTGSEFRVYFYFLGRLCYARSFDSEARGGTWEVLREDGSFGSAINFGESCSSVLPGPVGPNPHVTWHTRSRRWVMTLWQWQSPTVRFLWSYDGMAWTQFASLDLRDDRGILHRPFYPTVVGPGGSQQFSGDGYLYYAHWTADWSREMRYRTISIY